MFHTHVSLTRNGEPCITNATQAFCNLLTGCGMQNKHFKYPPYIFQKYIAEENNTMISSIK